MAAMFKTVRIELLAFGVSRDGNTVNSYATAMDWSKAVDQKTRSLLEHCLARSAIGRVGG